MIEKLNELALTIQRDMPSVNTEEATKMSFIMPFFQILGYDVFNSRLFVPEYDKYARTTGSRVDYAIINNGDPLIIVEAKESKRDLKEHIAQLEQYYNDIKPAIGILTNGIHYWFFCDLATPNKMDSEPYYKLDMLNLRPSDTNMLVSLCFNNELSCIMLKTSAQQYRCASLVRKRLEAQLKQTSDAFVSYAIDGNIPGKKTKQTIEQYRSIVQQSLKEFIRDHAAPQANAIGQKKLNMKTLPEEYEAFGMVKAILANVVNMDRITMIDKPSYCIISLDGKAKKLWICHLQLERHKWIRIHEFDPKMSSLIYKNYPINTVDDIYLYKDKLIQSVKKMLE